MTKCKVLAPSPRDFEFNHVEATAILKKRIRECNFGHGADSAFLYSFSTTEIKLNWIEMTLCMDTWPTDILHSTTMIC